MDENYLLETANKLCQVSEQAADEYVQKFDRLSVRINEAMLARPDIATLVGADNLSMMADNHANHQRFVASILKYKNSEVLVSTMLWVFRAHRSRGFSQHYWPAQLNAWTDILSSELSAESYAEIYPFYEWMLINIPSFVKLSDLTSDKIY